MLKTTGFFKILPAFIIFILVLGSVLGCQKTDSEYRLDIVDQVWNIIFEDYVDRDNLDANGISHAAVASMLDSLDDPDTPDIEGQEYQADVSRLDEEGIKLIEEAWDIIADDTSGQVDTENLKQAAIEGMIEALNDPYTSYLESEYYELGVSSLEGEFEGIGAYVTVHDGKLSRRAMLSWK
jgi:C-terminal processing protease CtpA/Prc